MSDKKKYIIRLIRNVNKSKLRKRKMYPLEYIDDGWRICFPKSLEAYDFIPSGKKLLESAVYDLDGRVGYYWIPIGNPPPRVITPALRLMQLSDAMRCPWPRGAKA
jgi:hypothetical protein